MMIAASYSPETRSAISIAATPGNCSSGAGARSWLTRWTCLPRARSANAIASCEPIESPSGRLCDERTKRWRWRIASTIRSNSGLRLVIVFVNVKLVQELLDAVLARNRLVVDECQLGSPLQPQPRANLAAQKRRGAVERAPCVNSGLLVAERGVEHPRQLQVGRDLDARQGDEADPRIVDLARQQR